MANNYIFVTGSAGFIGFHFCAKLLKQGYQVIGIDNFNEYYPSSIKERRSDILKQYKNFTEYKLDIEDYSNIKGIFEKYKISCVCNLAAQAGVRYSLKDPFIYEKNNILGFLNILELVKSYGIPRIVYASSSSVYGHNEKIPFSEYDSVDNPVSFYAVTKRTNELMAYCYSHLYGFESIGLRFFTVYGAWGRPDMAMWIFADAILSRKKIKLFNSGNIRRNFTYIDDIVNGIISSVFFKTLNRYEIFNLGNCMSEPLMKMISIIEKELGIEGEKEMLPMEKGDVIESFADIGKARKILGFNPSVSIEEGIPIFLKWYKSYRESLGLNIK